MKTGKLKISIKNKDPYEIVLHTTAATVEEIIDAIRGRGHAELMKVEGGYPLGNKTHVPYTVIMINSKIIFDPPEADRKGKGAVSCTLSGGNIIAFDADGSFVNPVSSAPGASLCIYTANAVVLDPDFAQPGIPLTVKLINLLPDSYYHMTDGNDNILMSGTSENNTIARTIQRVGQIKYKLETSAPGHYVYKTDGVIMPDQKEIVITAINVKPKNKTSD